MQRGRFNAAVRRGRLLMAAPQGAKTEKEEERDQQPEDHQDDGERAS